MTAFPEPPKYRTSADPMGPRSLLEAYTYTDTERDIEIVIPAGEPLAPSTAPKEAGMSGSEWHTSPGAFAVHTYVCQLGDDGPYTWRQSKRLLMRLMKEDRVPLGNRLAVAMQLPLHKRVIWGVGPRPESETDLPPVDHQATTDHGRVRYLNQRLLSDYKVTTREGHEITVPAGFIFDMASVPESFWSARDPQDFSVAAALIHDYIYGQDYSEDAVFDDGLKHRNRADRLFDELMERANVDPTTRRVGAAAVRWFGKLAWRKNARRVGKNRAS